LVKWLTNFGCANEFLGLCHAFFCMRFILGHGPYPTQKKRSMVVFTIHTSIIEFKMHRIGKSTKLEK
jgi:hypothetical protein